VDTDTDTDSEAETDAEAELEPDTETDFEPDIVDEAYEDFEEAESPVGLAVATREMELALEVDLALEATTLDLADETDEAEVALEEGRHCPSSKVIEDAWYCPSSYVWDELPPVWLAARFPPMTEGVGAAVAKLEARAALGEAIEELALSHQLDVSWTQSQNQFKH
jgi:hypothetical protein